MGTTIGGAKPPSISDINVPAVSDSSTTTQVSSAEPSNKPQTDPQTEARHAEASRNHGNDNKPQHEVRASYIQQQLSKQVMNSAPKAPEPHKYVPKDGVKTKEDTSAPTTFAPSKSAVGDASRISSKVEYEKLPEDLKSKMNQQFWGGLGDKQRQSLVETYSRMKDYGVWDEVKRVVGEKNPPERNVKIAGKEFEAAGNSGGIVFEAKNPALLQKKLIATGHFGKDGDIMGSQHKGQISDREWKANDQRGMHVSIGPGNKFDVHIDKFSPVKEPVHGKTQVDINRAKKHGQYELVPEKFRKKTGIPGAVFDLSVKENREGWHGGELNIGVKIEVHGPVKKKVELSKSGPDSANPAAEKILAKIDQRVEKAQIYFPTPIGSNPDHVPNPKAIATRMAAEMMDAARNGRTSIQLNIPEYLDKKGDQAAVIAAMKEIGEIVRSEMVASDPNLDSVRRLTVTFGSKKQGETVALD